MSAPTPDPAAAAAAAYTDTSWQTAPLEELFAGFRVAMDGRDFDKAQRCLHWLQARLTTARGIEIPAVLSRP